MFFFQKEKSTFVEFVKKVTEDEVGRVKSTDGKRVK